MRRLNTVSSAECDKHEAIGKIVTLITYEAISWDTHSCGGVFD